MPSIEHDSIQQWFLNEIPQNVTKEVNIDGLSKRRLDVVLESPNVAIEIQCSPIGIKEYNDRSLDIILCGYFPIWVFGRGFYQKARSWKRYGSMISKTEKAVFAKNKSIFYHNKYDLFTSSFIKKRGCEFKGWHNITKLSLLGFFNIITRIYELKPC